MRKQIRIFLMTALEVAALFLFASQSLAEMPYTTTKSQDCGQNYGAPKGRVGLHRIADPEGGWQTKGFVIDSFGPMPQTAYDPNYGCYPGNARTIHRYPAFHGYYYDRPYNYRQYSEYPWNAEIVEPRPYPDRAKQYGSEVIMESVTMPSASIMEPAPTPAPEVAPVTKSVPTTKAIPTKKVLPTTQAIPAPVEENESKEAVPVTEKNDTILENNGSVILDEDLLN